jgi:hypothetical protein
MKDKLLNRISDLCNWEINMADLEGRGTQEAKWRSYVAQSVLNMINLDKAVNPFYTIKYYFKDDPESISEATVCVGIDEDDEVDDEIFFYYDHIHQLHGAYAMGKETPEEFVVLNYWSVDEEDFDRDMIDEWVTVLNRDVVNETAESKHLLGRKITDAEWRSISNQVHHEDAGSAEAWAIAIEFLKKVTDK